MKYKDIADKLHLAAECMRFVRTGFPTRTGQLYPDLKTRLEVALKVYPFKNKK